MIEAEAFLREGHDRGYTFYSGVPCSYLKPFINYVIDSPDFQYVAAANEGDAVAVGAGAALAGKPAVVMFQNSGLGNAVSPLTSLTHIFRIPVLIIVTLRGQTGGPADEPQHDLMGKITTRQLDLMDIPWGYFPTSESMIKDCWTRATDHMNRTGRPFALVMPKGAVAAYALREQGASSRRPDLVQSRKDHTVTWQPSRAEVLTLIQKAAAETDPILASTGYAGRELYGLDDRSNQFYMVGSMGCVSSLGLGIALARPDRKVFVIDGDGAALMRMGALATIGAEAPRNLVHILLDNGVHESTGGQATVSRTVDFCAVAGACGYPSSVQPGTPSAFSQAMRDKAMSGPTFIYINTKQGVPDGLPRPKIPPEHVAQRFGAWLAERPAG